MSSNPARSSLLPPYAAPIPAESQSHSASHGASHSASRNATNGAALFTPFVPPTWIAAPAESKWNADAQSAAPAEPQWNAEAQAAVADAPEAYSEPQSAAAGLFEEPAPELRAAEQGRVEGASQLYDSADESLPWIDAFAEDSYETLDTVAEPEAVTEHEVDVTLDVASDTAAIADVEVESERAAISDIEVESERAAGSEIEVESERAAISDIEVESERAAISDIEVESELEAESEAVTDSQPQAAESEPDAEAWAIADAGLDIAQIVEELSSISASAASQSPDASNAGDAAAAPVPLAPWHDEEAWMDIMPALPNSGARNLAAETDWARAFAEPPAPMTPPPLPTGDAQAAALSLETIARRLREGELSVPGFRADAGDAAALAAALASLLGARD